MPNLKSLKQKQKRLQEEAKLKSLKYIIAAFGLVAGLAWNDAIKSFINLFFPLNRDSVIAKFIYAILMTIVLVIITIYLTKIFIKKK